MCGKKARYTAMPVFSHISFAHLRAIAFKVGLEQVNNLIDVVDLEAITPQGGDCCFRVFRRKKEIFDGVVEQRVTFLVLRISSKDENVVYRSQNILVP